MGERRTSRDADTFGRIVVVSTDGRVRREALWVEWSKVQQAIDHLLRVDPRRKKRVVRPSGTSAAAAAEA